MWKTVVTFLYLFSVVCTKDLKNLYSNTDSSNENIFTLCESDGGLFYYQNIKEFNECEHPVARAKYSNKINQTGWATIEVEIAKKRLAPHAQGYAAGFVEGRATKELIDLHISNTVEGYCEYAKEYCNALNGYLLENMLWTLASIQENPEDPYWIQANITYNQILGMIDGYENEFNHIKNVKELVAHPIYLIQLAGDLEDLEAKLKKPEHPTRLKKGRGRCSALVKVLPDNSDILFSHVTWSSYSTMLRMQKKYSFKTGDSGQSYSFSSYPGSVASVDDFILTSAKLAIFETTIGNYNADLYKYMTTDTLLCFLRSQIAHRTATTGKEWAEIFSKYNSGTYNNQWVVLDYKEFHKGNSNKKTKGLLHVLEQMPGTIVHKDMSKHLVKENYWPSYNCPFFKTIFNISDAPKMVEKYGEWFSYDKTPRALIFKRDHDDVVDMDTMTALMRSNDYTNDPLSRCDCSPPYSGENAISCRSDLNPANGTYPFPSLGFRDHGATDMKLTNSYLIDKLAFSAIAGPTYGNVPVFDWDTSDFKDRIPHRGQPSRWTFGAVIHKWSRHGLFQRN